jgi:hypothetical protein
VPSGDAWGDEVAEFLAVGAGCEGAFVGDIGPHDVVVVFGGPVDEVVTGFSTAEHGGEQEVLLGKDHVLGEGEWRGQPGLGQVGEEEFAADADARGLELLGTGQELATDAGAVVPSVKWAVTVPSGDWS